MPTMKRKVRLALESRQEDEVTSHLYEGQWIRKGGSIFLLYEEHEENQGTVRTTLRWNERELKIIRRGAVHSEQRFITGARLRGEYRAAQMRFELETLTERLDFEGGGALELPLTLRLHYTLHMNEEAIGKFIITFKIQEADEG